MVTNSQECQKLIQNINSAIVANQGFMQNPEEQYKQRNNYIEVLEYALKSDELYHLYDIWQVFAQAREEATRGFFLDLWDLYQRQEGSDKKQRERDILRYFVCQIHDQFDEILLAKKITAPNLWQKYVGEVLRKLMWIENEQEMQLERKLLYSMSYLYVYLYPNESLPVNEEKEFLIGQLQIAEDAISCRAKKNNSSIVLTKVFSNDENSNLQREFTQREFTLSFLYLYRFVNHFAVISLKDFVKKVIDSLKEEEFIKQVGQETGEELLDRLLRYWGANSPLMRFFLQEKLGFKFYEYAQPEAIKLPSLYGTDNFVYTIGASGVGKTYLFHAMEYSSKKSEEQLPLSIKYIDASEESEPDIKKWEAGEELEARENHLIYMQSKVRNLCRFTFYEIEDTQIIGTKWQSLKGYFERRLPSAIILVFSTEEKNNLKYYDFLVNLLDDFAKEDERYRNIPIYFIFNKSDQFLEKIQQSQECDQQLFDQFQKCLNSQIELSERFNFFSLRYQKTVKQIGTLEIVNRTKACCVNLAFIAKLNQDITRVKKIIDSLFDKNFTNLSFIYTSSLFDGNKQHTDLQKLWSDLSNFIIKATCEDLEKYYQREFQTKLDRHFQQVDRFYSTAEIRANLEFSKNSEGIDVFELLNETPDPNSQKLKDDFNNLLKIKEINISDILSLNSGVESAFDRFAKQKELHSHFLDTALKATLTELGIPIKKSQTEDFYIKELEFIEPKDYDTIWQFDVTSPSVENFLENKEYQQITEQIKQVLWKNISNYNNNRGKGEPLRISEEHLKIIIEQLPKQLQLIDIANRNEAFESSIREKFSFSDTLSNKSSLCLIQRGLFDKSDQDLIQGTERGQTVFDRLCQLIDFDQAKKYCKLLSNYLPKHPNKPNYPQFILVKRQKLKRQKPPSDKIQVEFDNIKIDILKNLAEKLEKQQELLLSLVEILLKNRHELQNFYKGNSDEYKKNITHLYSVKYLLKVLESCGFRVERFQEEPDEIIKKISHVYNELSKLESMNLESLGKEYQEITSSSNLLLFNPKDIKGSGEKIATELKTAFNIYTEILKILKLIKYDNEQLKSLSKDIIQKFIISQTNEYNNILKNYEKQRKMLLIEERVKYLKASKWIEDLNWLKESFEEYDFRRNIIDMNTEELNEWKQRFVKSIDELLKKQLFSHKIE